MSWPSILVLVRHAESDGNVLNRDERASFEKATWSYGLTENGKRQAKITGDYLRFKYGEFDVYYTSYYTRAKDTMAIIYPEAKVYEDSRLAEAQRGIYHAMTREEIAKKYPEELIRKDREGLYHYRPPGGENWLDIEMRCHSFLGTLNRDYGGKKVLCVVHGHWLVLLERLLQHFSIDEAVSRYRTATAANASITEYTAWSTREMKEQLHFSSYTVPWQTGPSRVTSEL